MCKITLADGTVIGNLEMNGNNFISTDTSLKISDLEGKLATVTIQYEDEITGDTITQEMKDVVIDKFEKTPTEVTFVLNEKTTEQKAAEVIKKALETDSENIVDLQLAVVELYEMLIGE